MIRRYLKQTARWHRRTAADPYAGSTYSDEGPIKVRWHEEAQLVTTHDQSEVTSSAHVSAIEPISVGDLITGDDGREREVVAVRVNRDTRGAYSHRVAYLA